MPTERTDATPDGTRIEGVCPVVETPFSADGSIDPGALASLVDHLAATGVGSMMYPGFASESVKLNDAERDLLVSTVIARAHLGGSAVVASISDHATVHAVARARRAVELGADMINILPPHQLGPSARAVDQHIRAVLDAVPTTPVVLQFAPAQTGTALDAGSIARIADAAPNLVQVKVESTPPGRLIAALREQSERLTSVVGYAGLQLPDAMIRGAVGVQPGCSFVELYVTFWNLWQEGRVDDARALHRRMVPFLSYWMQGVELIVAAEKRISFLRGLIPTDVCREPRHELDRVELATIDEFLEEFHDELTIVSAGKDG